MSWSIDPEQIRGIETWAGPDGQPVSYLVASCDCCPALLLWPVPATSEGDPVAAGSPESLRRSVRSWQRNLADAYRRQPDEETG